MNALIIIYSLILIVFMFTISHLWDRLDKLQKETNQQRHEINHMGIVVEMMANDVYEDKG